MIDDPSDTKPYGLGPSLWITKDISTVKFGEVIIMDNVGRTQTASERISQCWFEEYS
jgi:hypothetical protein